MSTTPFHLNQRALVLADALAAQATELRITTTHTANGTRILDCGSLAIGSLEAGRILAEICLAGLGNVAFSPNRADLGGGLAVTVRTDQPLAACMASQYAGWQIAAGKFFAMGSGPMRAAGSREPLFEEIGFRERPEQIVGVLETSKLPPLEVCDQLALDCGVAANRLTLLCASTHSLAGTVQVVARSVETALHKMHQLGFDLHKISSGFGTAPLPPIANDFLTGIGRTNDAILYGGEVTLWVQGDDASLAELGSRIPSSSSNDYGEPFRAIFERYQCDFYKIDPFLFSPAMIQIVNLTSGKSHCFGKTNSTVLEASFFGSK